MRYLKKHNEIFGFFNKKDTNVKNSMWIINPSLNLIDPGENIYKYHVDIIDDRSEKFNIDDLSKKQFDGIMMIKHFG